MRHMIAAVVRRTRRHVRSGALLLLLPLAACRVSEDAAAASAQMTKTAVVLRGYYVALSGTVSDTIELYELDAALSGIPFDAEQRKLPEETQAEIHKRAEMAEQLARLAQAMTALSHSTAASDAETAANALGKELVSLQAMPGGSPIPDAIPKAGQLLVELVQQHEEQKAARAMDTTLAALGELFAKEKPVYDSLARTHLRQAAAVAKDLVARNAVDPAPMLAPALKPFALAPLPASGPLQESLKTLALARLDRRVDAGTAREMNASQAMLDALQEMSRRVHLLATEKMLKLRGNPVSLETVEAWSASQPSKGV